MSLTSACLAAGPRRPTLRPTPVLQPELFFAGHTHGEGTVAVRGRAPQPLRVDGHGTVESDGTFRLDQTLTIGDAPAETRTWRLRRTGATTYMATLSDARGQVTAESEGNRFHLRYLIRHPAVVMEQWLYLEPDGRTVRNIATISVLGLPWVRLAEGITRDTPLSALP
ncbi:MAG: DUF3833 family protein [Candidatus Eremiobacteraeota bacterium]|nr:DUF3833 family protein [Candidatus Eremiobacteraeota bacterium]